MNSLFSLSLLSADSDFARGMQARLALARAYENGGLGLQPDVDKARHWFELAEASAVP